MSNKVRDIPGFYYDNEKRKYFKITKEFKPPKKIEENKLKDRKFSTACGCVANYLQHREYGLKYSRKDSIFQSKVLQEFASTPLKKFHHNHPLEFLSAKVALSGEFIILKDNQDNFWNCKVSRYRSCGIDLSLHDTYPVRASDSKSIVHITSYETIDDGFVCSAQVEDTSQYNGIIHYSKVILHRFIDATDTRIWMFRNSHITSVAQSSPGLIIGNTNKLVCVVRPSSSQFVKTWKLPSIPHVLKSSTQNTSEFLAGCENGKIVFIDVRKKSIVKIFKNQESKNYRIDCIKVLPDGHQFIASDWNGLLRLYDLRNENRIVCEYKGNVNNHSDKSFYISNNHIYALGTDSILRSWNISSGELLAQVSMTTSNSKSPVFLFSNNFLGSESAFLSISNCYYKYFRVC